MSQPLNTQSELRAVDTALKHSIEHTKTGKGDISELFGIEKKLETLAKSREVPEHVKAHLQTALKELKEIKVSGMDLSHLNQIKSQIGEAITASEKGIQKKEGGSLGEGSPEE